MIRIRVITGRDENPVKIRWEKRGNLVLDLHGKMLQTAISLCDDVLNQVRNRKHPTKILIITGIGQNSRERPALFNGIRNHIQEYHRDFSYHRAPPKLGGDGAILVERVC